MTESGWDQGGGDQGETWPDGTQGGEGIAEVDKEKAVKKDLQDRLLCELLSSSVRSEGERRRIVLSYFDMQ